MYVHMYACGSNVRIIFVCTYRCIIHTYACLYAYRCVCMYVPFVLYVLMYVYTGMYNCT